jgi:hypothetical protein
VSHRDENGTVWIAPEPDGRCELCGAVDETRPYGPGGKQICFACGQLDPEGTERRMGQVLFGDSPEVK